MEKELEKIITNLQQRHNYGPDILRNLRANAISEIISVYAPIVNSLKEANAQNSQLLQEKLKLENDILALKNTIKAFENKTEDFDIAVIDSCKNGIIYYNCDIWDKKQDGCMSCEFFKGTKAK